VSLIASDHFRIVVGLGKSGMSLVRFLANRGTSFAVADTRENPPELATLKRDYPHVEVRCGELDVEFLCRADELYVSPGLALATPALQAAAARGVKLSGDIELFARNAKAPIVAISGSNAKAPSPHWSARWLRRPASESPLAATSVRRHWTCSATTSSCT
jgi:UDP-N-acetylmuramoylalanine-D-glutamate ligase